MVRFPLQLPAEIDAGDGLLLSLSGGELDEDRFGHLSDDEVDPVFLDLRLGRERVGKGIFHAYGDDWGSFEDIWVTPANRRRGIATRTYDAIEALGVRVVRSDSLDFDGESFWAARDARMHTGSMTP